MSLDPDHIEALRDRIYCRTPELRIRTVDQALEFVNRVGFCFAFKANRSELPCLWHAACGEREPAYPRHVQHDPNIGLVWTAKDILPARRQIYYGKALKKRPTMISLEYLPFFYRLMDYSTAPDAYIAEYMAGRLSSTARTIMDALSENPPMTTADLKLASNMANPSRRADFDKAMAELQMKMFVLKIGEFYDPFTFLWDVFANRFPEVIEMQEDISFEQARYKILKQYFTTVLISNTAEIQRLFGWPADSVIQTLQQLKQDGLLQEPLAVKGQKSRFWGLAGQI